MRSIAPNTRTKSIQRKLQEAQAIVLIALLLLALFAMLGLAIDSGLAYMQIFGGPTTATITATATSIVGNQRQTPAILTLNPNGCSLNMKGGGSLTVLGDVYANGQACVDANLNEAGNCYGAAGSTCSSASYWCYNSSPGFVPYDPNGPPPPSHPVGGCASGDTIGAPVVPAPSLPDPGYLAPS